MLRLALAVLFALLVPGWAAAQTLLSRDEIARMVPPPYDVGVPLDDKGTWQLLNSGGQPAGFIFETLPRAALPGFAGAPINALVVLDREGGFIAVRLLAHNEPIFVSGLGEAPFRAFFDQYTGHSVWTDIVVGTPYGGGASSLVEFDGILRATASVRIAHESVMAAARQVAREYLQGRGTLSAARPDMDHDEALDWAALVEQGIAGRLTVTNAQIDAAFAGSRFAQADPAARAAPEAAYLDLWVVDVTPPAIARAVLGRETIREMDRFRGVAPHDEFLLVIDAGRHGLVDERFVRNTEPELIRMTQGGLPVPLRDADFWIETLPGVPQGAALILRTDRRLGFDPAQPFDLTVIAERRVGTITPETGRVDLTLTHTTPERFFVIHRPVEPLPPWAEAILARQTDLAILAAGLAGLVWALGAGLNRFAGWRWFTPARLAILAAMTGFVGWWGQGQLSIVTPLGALRAGLEGQGLGFLLYDPFSLAIWAAAALGFVLWGRGLFCGWLCPFGALQEFAHHLGRLLRLPQIEPSAAWDRVLRQGKWLALGGLAAIALFWPAHLDTAAEIEPFKTAISTYFRREWVFVAYAGFWLVLGMVLFKGFCRYLCPLGALMALGGLLRRRDWIARRAECGSPCQLCRVKCLYKAIEPSGRVRYGDCFQCLDCVAIHQDARRCVPLVLAARGRALGPRPAPGPVPAAVPALGAK